MTYQANTNPNNHCHIPNSCGTGIEDTTATRHYYQNIQSIHDIRHKSKHDQYKQSHL